MFQTNRSKMMSQFAKYTVRCYSELDLDEEFCIHWVGSIEVAATPERSKGLERKHGLATLREVPVTALRLSYVGKLGWGVLHFGRPQPEAVGPPLRGGPTACSPAAAAPLTGCA